MNSARWILLKSEKPGVFQRLFKFSTNICCEKDPDLFGEQNLNNLSEKI